MVRYCRLFFIFLKERIVSLIMLSKRTVVLILIAVSSVLNISCTKKKSSNNINMAWQPIDSLNAELPDGIRVFEGIDENLPLKAWYAKISNRNEDIRVEVAASDDSTGRETVASFAKDLGACLVVNGGFFRMDLNPTRHVGLLAIGDEILESATKSVIRDSLRFYIARGAVGFSEDGKVDIAWVSNRNDSLFEWKEPFENYPYFPGVKPEFSAAEYWDYPDALSAGPVLVQDSEIRVTSDEEVFFGTSIPNVHPRTAVGYTAKGELLLLVVDGRQGRSRGVDLNELSQIMISLGAVEALNLDGGGSSSMVVNGVLLNFPAGGSVQREVMSAIAVFCN